MTIRLKKEADELLLYYAPEMGTEGIKDKLQKNEFITIKHTYIVNWGRLIREDAHWNTKTMFPISMPLGILL